MASQLRAEYRCCACGAVSDFDPCVVCGSEAVERRAARAPHPSAPVLRAAPLQLGQPQKILRGRGELFRTTGGGAPRGRSIVVVGPAGVGKSTLAFEAAASWAAASRGRVLWCDAEMDASLCGATASRSGATPKELALVDRIERARWREIADVADRYTVFAIDSLHAHARTDVARGVLMRRLCRLAAERSALCLVIARLARAGHLSGAPDAEYEADAVVYVEEKTLSQTKCRWAAPCVVKRRG